MRAVLRPSREAVAEAPRSNLDVLRFEADAEAVVAYDGLGRAHRFARDGSDTAPVAIGVVDGGGQGPPLYRAAYLALLDAGDRALAWHAPSHMWDPHDVARFARASGLRYTWVNGVLRKAPGGHSLMAQRGDRALTVAVLGTMPAMLVLGVLGVASHWVLGLAGLAAVLVAAFGVRFLPARKRRTARGTEQAGGVPPPGDGPAAG